MKKIYLRVTDYNTADTLCAASWSDSDGETFADILSIFSEKKPRLYKNETLRDNCRNAIHPGRLSNDCFSFTVSSIYARVDVYCQYRVDSPTGPRLYSVLLCEV